MSSQKKTKEGRMYIRVIKNPAKCKRSRCVPAVVRTASKIEHLVSKGVQIMEVVSQDLEKLDVEVEINLDTYPKFKVRMFIPYFGNHESTSIGSNHKILIYES